MKRMFVALMALLLLAGCSGNQESTMVTRACSLEESGASVVMEAAAQSEEDNVETITLTLSATYEYLGVEADDLTEEEMEEYKSQMESLMALSFSLIGGDYYEITTSEFDDAGYNFVMVMDVQAMIDAEGDDSYYSIDLDTFATSMEEDGFTCN